MRDEAVAEEALLTREGAVDELVDQHEVAGRQFLAERAAGRDRDEIGDAGALHRVDVGAVVDAGGRELVAAAVTRQEADRQASTWSGDLREQDLVGRRAPRARHRLPARVLKPGRL